MAERERLQKLANGRYKTVHHPEGIEESKIFFNEKEVTALVLSWQQTQETETWQAIVLACLPLIDTVIRTYRFQRYDEMDALRSECVIKLAKMVSSYDPAKGGSFSFFNVGLKRFLLTYACSQQRLAERVTATEEQILENQPGRTDVREGLSEEIQTKIRQIRTRFKTREQRQALKFLINYFLLESFNVPKAAVIQLLRANFQITYGLAQLLYDYALISLRVATLGDYSCRFSSLEMLRLSQRFSVIPEMAELIGLSNLKKLIDIYGGITLTFPTRMDLERLAKERAQLNSSPGSALPHPATRRDMELQQQIEKEYHLTEPLFAEEEAASLSRE
jgi:hypothetical protein